ncbi:MAG TPA: 50S ribosomal protein L15 [Chloroflexia bacterium]|nr:50S ribosomal protein L15 [Chloroflexia bacterium]
MELSDLRSPEGAFKKRKRVGRGPGSGHGKTAGRGQKGQKARSGHHYVSRHFEGGQTPIQQQLPYKRGFKNRFRVEYTIVSLENLEAIETDTELTPDVMVAAGLIRDTVRPVKVLGGGGELTRALRVQAHRFSGSAKQAIEAAGGQTTLIGGESEAVAVPQEAGA